MDASSVQEIIAARPFLTVDAVCGVMMEGVPLAALAAAHGTPSWVYGAGTLRARAARLRAALPDVALHYAVKANDHLAVLDELARAGLGADVVSAGELARALRAGFAAPWIVFSGVGKSAADIQAALTAGIGQINVESAEELALLSDVAMALGRTANVALRVNPDVDAGTHDKISTGRAGDKFGIPHSDIPALYAQGSRLPGINMVGLAVHIGSQIRTAAPFAAAYARLASLVRTIRAQGQNVAQIDCGGGIGIAYDDAPALLPEAWFGAMQAAFAGLDVTLAAEPGRYLAGPAGLLLSRVVRTRHAGMPRPLVILDAAMNDLLRPAMYGAHHAIIPVSPAHLHAPCVPTDIAGPVCESSDFFARARPLPGLPDGALVAILDAGAYGAVMSATYNARPLAAAIMVDRGRHAIIRPRQAPEAMWSTETLPRFSAP